MIATEDKDIQGGRSLWKVWSMAERHFTLGCKFSSGIYWLCVFFLETKKIHWGYRSDFEVLPELTKGNSQVTVAVGTLSPFFRDRNQPNVMCTPHTVKVSWPIESKWISGGEVPPIDRFYWTPRVRMRLHCLHILS